MNQKGFIRKRHIFYQDFIGTLIYPFLTLLFGYKRKVKYDNSKQNVFVVSNHQTDLDAVYLSISFKEPVYFLATDSISSNKLAFSMLNHIQPPVIKKKGTMDSACIKKLVRVAREGGSIGVFPEGNRTYAEFQFPVGESISKLIKLCNIPVVIFNIHGGTGSGPRFKNKKRKGLFYSDIKRVIEPSEYKAMTDKELHDLIMNDIRVYDSESGNTYKSKRSAEYLERMLFVCPKCSSMNTIYSKGNNVYCSNCDLEVTYTEDLHLKSKDETFKFNILNDWYQYQKKYIKELDISSLETIFNDKGVKLYTSNANVQRKLISKGNISLTNDKLIFDKASFDVKDISIASVISGKNFNFTVNDNTYLVKGDKKFNPLKYVLMFNKLDTDMKINKRDEYFTLD